MQPIQLETRDAGVVIPVRAKPSARRNAIEGTHDGAVRISVTVAPEKGKANKAICELLAKALGISKSQVVLISGETSSQKRVLVHGKTAEEVQLALEQLLSTD